MRIPSEKKEQGGHELGARGTLESAQNVALLAPLRFPRAFCGVFAPVVAILASPDSQLTRTRALRNIPPLANLLWALTLAG